MVKHPAAPQAMLDVPGVAEGTGSTLQARPWWGPSDGRRVWGASWPHTGPDPQKWASMICPPLARANTRGPARPGPGRGCHCAARRCQ